MALIQCPECGKEISDKSANCVYCGYPLNEKTEDVVYDNENFDSRKFRPIGNSSLGGDDDYEYEQSPKKYSSMKAIMTGGLRNCPTCGKPIAQNAKKCPNCGRRDPFFASHLIIGIIAVVVFFLIVASMGRK